MGIHIVETSLSLLSHASMPLSYWSYAFATVLYLINHMTTSTLLLSSPYLKLFQFQLKYSKLCVFGCLCYPWLHPYSSHKLAPHFDPCVFLGYSLTQSACVLNFLHLKYIHPVMLSFLKTSPFFLLFTLIFYVP